MSYNLTKDGHYSWRGMVLYYQNSFWAGYGMSQRMHAFTLDNGQIVCVEDSGIETFRDLNESGTRGAIYIDTDGNKWVRAELESNKPWLCLKTKQSASWATVVKENQ